ATGLAKELSGFAAFDTKITGLNAFPNFKNPGVLVLRLSNSEKFENLYTKVNETCSTVTETEFETRRFIPHITIGRVKNKFRMKDDPEKPD
ncbi:hypothetical protein DF186_16205, partial [Enterococcus hirae]